MANDTQGMNISKADAIQLLISQGDYDRAISEFGADPDVALFVRNAQTFKEQRDAALAERTPTSSPNSSAAPVTPSDAAEGVTNPQTSATTITLAQPISTEQDQTHTEAVAELRVATEKLASLQPGATPASSFSAGNRAADYAAFMTEPQIEDRTIATNARITETRGNQKGTTTPLADLVNSRNFPKYPDLDIGGTGVFLATGNLQPTATQGQAQSPDFHLSA